MADLYINCDNTDLSLVDLLRAVAVDGSGDLYFDCDNASDESILDVLRGAIVEDASGNPAIAVYLSGGGSSEHEEFTTIATQTVFNASITLDANYKVFVDGIFQSWGHTRVGNVVTFGVPFAAGHEVSIHQ